MLTNNFGKPTKHCFLLHVRLIQKKGKHGTKLEVASFVWLLIFLSFLPSSHIYLEEGSQTGQAQLGDLPAFLCCAVPLYPGPHTASCTSRSSITFSQLPGWIQGGKPYLYSEPTSQSRGCVCGGVGIHISLLGTFDFGMLRDRNCSSWS